jgi:WD40 repeat protein
MGRELLSESGSCVVVGKLDGQETILIGDYRGNIHVCDTVRWKTISSFVAHNGRVIGLALYKNAIVSAGTDNKVKMWRKPWKDEEVIIDVGDEIESISTSFGDYLALATDRGVMAFDLPVAV